MSHANFSKFLESWSDELSAQAQRVRLLIGDAHWLSDGSHKEAVLRSFLSRYLPKSLEVGSGFAINPEAADHLTRQQDILIADISVQAPYLVEDSFLIVPSTCVVGTIEVKSTLSGAALQDALSNVIYTGSVLSGSSTPPWRGIVFFSSQVSDSDQFHRWVQAAINKIPAKHISPADAPICIISVGNFIAFLDLSNPQAGRLRVLPARDKSLAFGVLLISQKYRRHLDV